MDRRPPPRDLWHKAEFFDGQWVANLCKHDQVVRFANPFGFSSYPNPINMFLSCPTRMQLSTSWFQNRKSGLWHVLAIPQSNCFECLPFSRPFPWGCCHPMLQSCSTNTIGQLIRKLLLSRRVQQFREKNQTWTELLRKLNNEILQNRLLATHHSRIFTMRWKSDSLISNWYQSLSFFNH